MGKGGDQKVQRTKTCTKGLISALRFCWKNGSSEVTGGKQNLSTWSHQRTAWHLLEGKGILGCAGTVISKKNGNPDPGISFNLEYCMTVFLSGPVEPRSWTQRSLLEIIYDFMLLEGFYHLQILMLKKLHFCLKRTSQFRSMVTSQAWIYQNEKWKWSLQL